MDILLIKSEGDVQIRPLTIHGMLWLQTHFDNEHWKAIASNQVKLPLDDAKALTQDAEKAGVSFHKFTELTPAGSL